MNGWTDFVRAAIGPEPDDPFVRLLRDKIGSGSQVIRANAVRSPDDRPPDYLVVLVRDGQISEMRIPHSPSFLRWSLESGTRLETPEEEALRFRFVLAERIEEVAAHLDQEQIITLLVRRVRSLAMPASCEMLQGDGQADHAARGQAPGWSEMALDERLAATARDLARSLRYPEQETAGIIDRAMAEYLDRRLQISERERFRELLSGGTGPGRRR